MPLEHSHTRHPTVSQYEKVLSQPRKALAREEAKAGNPNKRKQLC